MFFLPQSRGRNEEAEAEVEEVEAEVEEIVVDARAAPEASSAEATPLLPNAAVIIEIARKRTRMLPRGKKGPSRPLRRPLRVRNPREPIEIFNRLFDRRYFSFTFFRLIFGDKAIGPKKKTFFVSPLHSLTPSPISLPRRHSFDPGSCLQCGAIQFLA